MIETIGPFSSGVATGGAGVATNNQTSTVIVHGKVLAIDVVYLDSPPATTDVTVATSGSRCPAKTLLTLTDGNTDVTKYPRAQVHNTAGTALTYDGTRVVAEPIPVDDYVKVTIAQADAADYVNVFITVDR
jgi:hypothetical protein